MSPRLPAVTPRKLIHALERASFYTHHIAGSHYTLRHLLKPDLRVTVPYHNRDLHPATVKAILKQAELTLDDLLELL